ncbi:MAG TPA: arginine deiminase family protein, partial [Candidatus Polarisedimenticolaceae bacterium]|nr:arginine deiminase family protein [Candidatus Polarisedimenticolaceae bacterium]
AAVGRRGRAVHRAPRDAFGSDERIASEWRELGYVGPPVLARAIEQFDRLVELLDGLGIEVRIAEPRARLGLDSIYVRDAAVVCDDGAILCRMGKPARAAEPQALAAALESAGCPVLGAIDGDGRLEGGDVVWLDRRTLAVGRGYRTNDEGIAQLRELLGAHIDRLITVPLAHGEGPASVFHLMSMISPLDHDLALVHSAPMPIPFRETLIGYGIRLIEAAAAEIGGLACNVLTVAPRHCLMLDGNPRTRKALEQAGVRVESFAGDEICLKGAGGPTCLTRPLQRFV